MTKIIVSRQAKDNRVIGFRMTGHSGFAAAGKDIVCAAVSVLAQSAYYCLKMHLEQSLDYSAQEGSLSLFLKEAPNAQTEAAFMVAVLGFQAIEEAYPRYVKVLDN